MVHTAEIKVLKAGVFATEYKDWRLLDEGDRNWEQFQLWWQEAYNLKEETDFSASSYGFGAAATETETQVKEYDESVHQFSTAFNANATAFSNLTEANTNLGTNLSGSMTQIQEQIN